jgi:hypothetical protein
MSSVRPVPLPWDAQPPATEELSISSDAPGRRNIECFLPLNGSRLELARGKHLIPASSAPFGNSSLGQALVGTGSAAVASVPIDLSGNTLASVSFWFYWDAYANDDDLLCEFTANINSNPGGFYVDPNASSGVFAILQSSPGASFGGVSITRPSAAAWHHCAINLSRAVNTGVASVYVDGAAVSITTVLSGLGVGSTLANSTLYLLSRGNASLFGAGKLANFIVRAGYQMSARDVEFEFQRPWDLYEPRNLPALVSAGGGSLDLTQTTGVALSGSVSVSGDIQIGTNFNLTQSGAVGLTGSLATTGNIQIGTTFNLAQTAAVGLAGSVGVSGDIQILSGSLDLTQTSAVAMSGTVGLSGDIQIGTTFNLAQTAAVGLTGSVATTGNIQIGTNFNLAQSVALAMSGSVAVSGDLQSGTAPVVTQAYGNFGWDPRIRPSWKRKELREELEAALDDAPKAVKILVETTASPQAPEPLREALTTVRKARKYNERAVTRQEIDELHEALETVATFTREREAARQTRRRKQQHFLLLS